jgi:RimJ/RimL family protein N-acetyltransferase
VTLADTTNAPGHRWPDDTVIAGDRLALREKRLDDAPNDYAWRRDPELAKFDAVPPLQSTFRDYLIGYEEGLRYPGLRRRRFAIVTRDGEHIGNCTYYDIDDFRRQAELGITIGDRNYWGNGYGTETVGLLLDLVFQTTPLRRIYLHTLDWNVRAQRCFQKAGFREIDRSRQNGHMFVLMEIRRDEWAADRRERGLLQE